MDEARLELDPVLRNCWMARGQQHRVPLPRQRRQSQPIFGGLNWRTGRVSWTLPPRTDSQGLVGWLEQLLVDYPEQFVVVVMDNVSTHHSAMARAAFALFEARLMVVYLPPFSPQLNLIERYWRHLKDRVCANKLYPSLADLREAVVNELQRQNQLERPDRFQVCK